MTFNTTSISLIELLKSKRLLVREPLQPRSPVTFQRRVLVTPEIDALLDGHPQVGLFPEAAAEVLIGKFTAGYLVTVSRRKNSKRPDVEQLEGFDEIWALCPRKPPPGWRLLGRFESKGVFVALRAWDKTHLAGKYGIAASQVVEDWEELFKSEEPHSADSVEGYLGGVFIDVDEPQK